MRRAFLTFLAFCACLACLASALALTHSLTPLEYMAASAPWFVALSVGVCWGVRRLEWQRAVIGALLSVGLSIGLAAISPPLQALTPGQELLLNGGLKPTVYTDFTQGVLPSSNYTYSGASLRTITDATGAITSASNNLLLNNATLSTQGVTVSPAWNYMLAFYGTGSVTLSGSAVATLSGSTASTPLRGA